MQSSPESVYHLVDVLNTTYPVRRENDNDRDTLLMILPSLPGFSLVSQCAGSTKDNKGL